MDVKKGVYMAFEKFTQTGKSYRPKISIRSNGQIGFNFGCIEKFSLEKYKYAVFGLHRAGCNAEVGSGSNDRNEPSNPEDRSRSCS